MAYQPQRSPGQNYGGPTNVSAIASRASEVGRMTGVTPEIWDDVLQQMQQLVEDNEKLRETLKHNNSDITALLKSKEDEVKHLHKLYWDARVSVLGFKAQIVKLTGEGERQQQLIQQQSGSSFVRKLEDENKKLEDEKRKLEQNLLSTKDLAKNLQDELNSLQTNLSSVERKEKKLTYDIQSLQEENVHLRQQLTCPQPHPPTSQGEVDSLQRMLDELKLEVSQERRVNSDLRSKCDQLASEASSAKSRGDYDMSKLQKENAQLKTKVSQQEHTIQEYKSDLEIFTEEASSEHNDLKSKIRYLEDEVKRRDTSLQTKEKELEEYRQRPDNPSSFVGGGGVTAAKRRLNDELGKNKELTREINLLKEQLASAASREEITTIEREKNKLIHDKDREVRQLKREKENLQRELDESRAEEREEYEQQLASARDEYTHLEAEKRQALDQLQNEKERYHELSVDLSKVTSELEQARKQLQHMKDSSVDNSEMDTYMQEMSTEITALSEDIARKREEIKRQQAQITQLAKERDEAVTKFTSLQEEFKAKQEEFKKKDLQTREENQRKIKEYIDDADHWRIQYETAQEDFGSERHAREKEANAVDALRSNRESLQKQVDEFKKKVTDQQRTIATLEDKLAKLDPNFVPEGPQPPRGDMPPDRVPLSGPPRPMGGGGGGGSPGPKRSYRSGEQESLHQPGPGGERGRSQTTVQTPRGGGEFGGGYGRRHNDFPPQNRYPDRPPGGNFDPRRPSHESPNYHDRRPDDRDRRPDDRGRYSDDRGRRPEDRDRRPEDRDRRPEDRDRRPEDRDRRPEDRDRRPEDRSRYPDDYVSMHPARATHSGHGGGGPFGGQRPFNPGGGGGGGRGVPQPYTEFTPLIPPDRPGRGEGGGAFSGGGGAFSGGGGRSGGMNDLNQPRQQSGGGELSRNFGQGRGGGGGGGHDSSGMTPVRRQLPPEAMGGGGGGGGGADFLLPGDRIDSSKPTGACPICGVGNFATQTDLELHAAKCDKFM